MRKILIYGFKFSLKTFPVVFILFNLIMIVRGVLWGFSTFATQLFYDSVAGVIINNEPVSTAYFMIIALGLVFIFRNIIDGVRGFMLSYLTSKSNGALARIVHAKMARIDPVCLEDTKLHDDIDKASQGAGTVFNIINLGMTIVMFYVPYFIFMGFYLHYLKPQFVFAIVLIFVPVLFGQFIRTGIIMKFEDTVAPIRRKCYYEMRAIVDKEYFKETRILGAYHFFSAVILHGGKNS